MIIVAAALVLLNTASATASRNDRVDHEYFCQDHHPQRNLDLDQVMGMWYIIEIIQHKREEMMPQGSIYLRTCPTVHLARETRSELRLVWNERTLTVYYNIRLSDPNSPGFWMASGPHNDTASFEPYHHQMTGTIQVMKAVGNHIALTFCTRNPSMQLFSVLLAREPWLPRQQIQGVNQMLERRGLEPLFIKHACSRGFNVPVSLALILLTALPRFF